MSRKRFEKEGIEVAGSIITDYHDRFLEIEKRVKSPENLVVYKHGSITGITMGKVISVRQKAPPGWYGEPWIQERVLDDPFDRSGASQPSDGEEEHQDEDVSINEEASSDDEHGTGNEEEGKGDERSSSSEEEVSNESSSAAEEEESPIRAPPVAKTRRRATRAVPLPKKIPATTIQSPVTEGILTIFGRNWAKASAATRLKILTRMTNLKTLSSSRKITLKPSRTGLDV